MKTLPPLPPAPAPPADAGVGEKEVRGGERREVTGELARYI